MNRKILITALISAQSLIMLPAAAMPPFHDDAGSNRQTEMHQGQKPIEMMKEVLGLRDDQLDSVGAILKSQRELHMQQKRQYQQQHRKQFKAMHDEMRNKLSAVLDEEQLARFDAFARGMQMGGMQKGMHRGGGKPGKY